MSIILFNMHLLSANYVLGMMFDPLGLGWGARRCIKQSPALQELIFLRVVLTYNRSISVDSRECHTRGMHKMLWKCREAAFRRVIKSWSSKT